MQQGKVPFPAALYGTEMHFPLYDEFQTNDGEIIAEIVFQNLFRIYFQITWNRMGLHFDI